MKAIDHGVEIALLRSLDGCRYRSPVDGFMEDWVVGVVFLHGGEIIRAF